MSTLRVRVMPFRQQCHSRAQHKTSCRCSSPSTCCCCNPVSVLWYLHNHLQRTGDPNQETDLIRKQKKPANKNIKREICLRSRAQITASAPPAQPTPGAAMLAGKRYAAEGTTAAKLLFCETLNLIKCRKFKTN